MSEDTIVVSIFAGFSIFLLFTVYLSFQPVDEKTMSDDEIDRKYGVSEWVHNREWHYAVVLKGIHRNKIMPVFYLGKNGDGVVTSVMVGNTEKQEDEYLPFDHIKPLPAEECRKWCAHPYTFGGNGKLSTRYAGITATVLGENVTGKIAYTEDDQDGNLACMWLQFGEYYRAFRPEQLVAQ